MDHIRMLMGSVEFLLRASLLAWSQSGRIHTPMMLRRIRTSPCCSTRFHALAAGGRRRGRPVRAAGASHVTGAFGAEHEWGCPRS